MSPYRRFWQIFRLVLSLGLITWLVYSIDLSSLTFEVDARAMLYIVLALVIAFSDRILMAYKWDVLLRAKDIELPFRYLTGQYLSATFLGLFLPATLGADAVRTYAVSRDGVEVSDVISSIIIERVIGVVALLIFVLISILLSVFTFGAELYQSIRGVTISAAILLAALLAIGMLSMNRRVFASLNAGLIRLSHKVQTNIYYQKLREIYESYLKYKDQRAVLLKFLFLSFLENLFPIALSYSLSLALGLQVPLLFYFILVPIVLLLVRIPISIDGFGIQEGSFVYFLSLVGVPNSEALLLGILTHVATIISVLPGGVLYGLYGLSMRKGQKIQISTILDNPTGDLGKSTKT